MSKTYDTVILGAGWSGAVCARQLARAGRSVLVLEARARAGGRARTWAASAGGALVDLGCSWIHGFNEGNPAREIAHELGVAAHVPRPMEGVVYGPDGPLPADVAAGLRASLAAAQAATRTPYPPPPPTQSLASALLAPSSPLFSSPTATDPSAPSAGSPDPALAAGLARSLEIPLGLTLEAASLRWAGWEGATAYAGSDAAPEGGYQALVERVLEQAQGAGADIVLGAEVTRVAESAAAAGGAAVTVTAAGETYTARAVVCTIPLGALKAAPADFFSPPLPGRLADAVRGTHVGVLEKLLLRYDTAWWPRAHEAGSYTFLPAAAAAERARDEQQPRAAGEGAPPLAPADARAVLDAATVVVANFAAPALPEPRPVLLAYLSETPARRLLALDPADVADALHAMLVARFGVDAAAAPRPVESALTGWLTDPLCCGATTTPSVVSAHGERSPLDFKELGRPVWAGRLGFAGEHTDMEHRGSVAGAVVSGLREAERVERLLRLWEA